MNHRGHREHRGGEEEKAREVFDPARVTGPTDVGGVVGEGFDPLSYAVIGAAIEVHRLLGPGFLESAYERAMEVELELRGIRYESQAPIALTYKSREISEARMDLLVEAKLIVELKAVEALAPIHTAQLISYLRATKLKTGLLINFNSVVLRDGIKRVSL